MKKNNSIMKEMNKKVTRFERTTLGMSRREARHTNKALKQFGYDVAVQVTANIAEDVIVSTANAAGRATAWAAGKVVGTVKGAAAVVASKLPGKKVEANQTVVAEAVENADAENAQDFTEC